MQRKHLFIMDPIEKLNLALDSSLRIAHALNLRGHAVYFCRINDLFWTSGKEPHCIASELIFAKDLQQLKLGPATDCNLDAFQTIHMRKDPPFDMNYVTATWFLDPCRKATVVNHPQALRDFNEKLGTLDFPAECKRALVSSNPEQLLEFVARECNGDAVLKPLHLFGGRDITRIELSKLTQEQALQSIQRDTEGGSSPKLAQAFDARIFEGEIRAFTLNGKALSWCMKVPKQGSFLANTAAGAVLKSYSPSPELANKVARVAKKLVQRGVYFVGMDIIGDEISEINITSPRLLVAPGDTRDYYAEIASFLETC